MKQEPRPRQDDGKFAPGQPKPKHKHRRLKGSSNLISRDIKHGIIEAAVNHGRDGKGKDGLPGFFAYLLKNDLRSFAGLIKRVMPLQINGDVNVGVGISSINIVAVPAERYLTLEDAKALAAPALPAVVISEAEVIENEPVTVEIPDNVRVLNPFKDQ